MLNAGNNSYQSKPFLAWFHSMPSLGKGLLPLTPLQLPLSPISHHSFLTFWPFWTVLLFSCGSAEVEPIVVSANHTHTHTAVSTSATALLTPRTATSSPMPWPATRASQNPCFWKASEAFWNLTRRLPFSKSYALFLWCFRKSSQASEASQESCA